METRSTNASRVEQRRILSHHSEVASIRSEREASQQSDGDKRGTVSILFKDMSKEELDAFMEDSEVAAKYAAILFHNMFPDDRRKADMAAAILFMKLISDHKEGCKCEENLLTVAKLFNYERELEVEELSDKH